MKKPKSTVTAHGAVEAVYIQEETDWCSVNIPASVSGPDSYAIFKLSDAKKLRNYLDKAIAYMESK